MAVYDLEEQEQLAEFRTWWRQHGTLVTGVIVAAAVLIVGWQAWNWWQRSQASQAAALYVALEQAAASGDAKKTRDSAGELIDKYPRTTHATLGAMLSAKIQAGAGDAKTAKAQLSWAAEHASEEELADLARMRLAVVLLDEKAYQEAQEQLGSSPAPAYVPRHAEIRGDILAAQGKNAEALTAYREALAKLEALAKQGGDKNPGPYRDVLQVKMEALGGKL